MNDAIEAAALAMYGTPRLAERNRDMAERAINAAEAIIRADERAKVSEELLAATVQVTWPDGRTSLKLAEVMDAAREHYAAIARGRGETETHGGD